MSDDIEICIEELVLHGFPAGERYRIAQAIQQALEAMLAQAGFTGFRGESRDIARADRSIQMAHGANAEEIGSRVAGAIYDSFAGASIKGS